MLGGKQIADRLRRGELFESCSWVSENIRGASYDLRMARGRYAIIRRDGTHVRVGNNEVDSTGQVLRPGDFALLSSEEKLTLDPCTAGLVGAKFDFIRQGMLVLTGINVDPGYGSNGAKPLHFLLANMSDREIPLIPGYTKVATIQFHDIGDTAGAFGPKPLTNVDEISSQFFEGDAPDLALDLFRRLSDLERLQEVSANTAAKALQLEDRLTRVEGRVEGLHQGANQIILFGVILLATTITGVLAALLLQGGVFPRGDVSIGRLLGVSGAVALFGLGTGAVVWLLLCVASVAHRRFGGEGEMK